MKTTSDSVWHMFDNFLKNLSDCFRGMNLVWHGLAIAVTYLCVATGFDLWYFQAFRNSSLRPLFLSAALVGFFIPLFGNLIFLIVGQARKNLPMVYAAQASAQAALLGWLISSAYKVFTGRLPPATGDDLFRFGFWRGGIFWGWPSSHTAVAFAMAATLAVMFKDRKWVQYSAWIYAVYIGIGVSTSIHWFSDFAAGAIIGAMIGVVVGESFRSRLKPV